MAYFHCLIGGGSSGGGYELTVTCDAYFAGTTITATDGVTTLTQTCPSASPYEVVFAIPNGGEWTISGTISGQTYSTAIDIPDSLELHSVPEGSTVLPTDDIQTWLACAGITDKSYTTLNEVLADSTTLLALMSNNNAVDYLVRSTTWASGITADSTAMTDIGANNYCANTLLSDSTWAEAICNSEYFESVLNVKVPVMTSDTTPSGTVLKSRAASSFEGYKAFDNNNSTFWIPIRSTTSVNGDFIGYTFTSPKCIKKVKIAGNRFKNAVIQASNDGTSYTPLKNIDLGGGDSEYSVNEIIDNDVSYTHYMLKFTSASSNVDCRITELQFYGRVDV